MVSAMRLLAAALLVLAFGAQAEPQLSAELDAAEVALGDSATLTLRGRDLPGDLSAVDLSPLDAEFVVDTVGERTETGADLPIQTRVVRLYPRAVGSQELPALEMDGIELQLPPLRVVPPRQDGVAIDVHTGLSERRPWQRQQVVVYLEVRSPDAFYTLSAETPSVPGFDIIALPVRSRRETVDGIEYRTQRIGWALFPYTAGTHRLSLPLVRYGRGGRTRHQFAQPRIQLDVRKLPAWLPPTVPVGRVQVAATPPARRVLSTDHLHWWTVTVTGSGIAAANLPPVVRSVRSNARLQVLPADTERRDGAAADGLHGRAVHRVPVKALADGPLSLPALRLQYFDPASGRLVSRRFEPQRPWAFGWLWPSVAAAVLAVALVGALRRGLPRLRAARARRRARRHALRLVEQAIDGATLVAALRRLGSAEGWPGWLTLREWAQRWSERYRTGAQFPELIERLEGAVYAGAAIDVPAVRRGLAAELHQARRRRSPRRFHDVPHPEAFLLPTRPRG